MTRRLKNIFLWTVTLLQSLAVLAVVGWIFESPLPAPTSSLLAKKSMAKESDDLQAPDEDREDMSARIDQLRLRRWVPELFPKPSEPDQAPPPPPPPQLQVKLLAILKEDDRASAVFSTLGGELLTVGANDWLDPDSKHTRVIRIEPDRVELEHHSRSLKLALAPDFAKE